MEHKGSSKDGMAATKDGLFRLVNEKKSSYLSSEMQKDYQMSLVAHSSQGQSQGQEHNSSRSSNNSNSYSLQFQHESLPENVLSESGSCLDSGSPINHSRSINSCIPLGQAFPQMLGGITDFRKNLMVTVQTDVSPRDVLQNQGMLCVPTAEVSHLHQPVEQLERQRQRNRQRMKNLRLDPEFRAQERLRQRQRMYLKRQDPHFREKERVLQRVRVREKRNMIRALESGNGLLERLATPSAPPAPSSRGAAANLSDDSSSLSSPNGALVPTSNSGGRNSNNTNNNSSSSSSNSSNVGGGGSGSGGGRMNSSGTTLNQSNGSLTVYGTLVDGAQLSQHLLLPNNFLMPHNELHHHLRQHHHQHHHSLDHQHNGDQDPQGSPGLRHGCPGSFNFELCRNMLPNCKVCMKLYQDLSKHARGHKRNHRCITCGRVFRLKQHLKGHMKTHGDKHLACPHCPYKTCYNFALNRHMILKHSQGQRLSSSGSATAICSPPNSQQCPQPQQQQPLDVTQTNQMSKCSIDVVS